MGQSVEYSTALKMKQVGLLCAMAVRARKHGGKSSYSTPIRGEDGDEDMVDRRCNGRSSSRGQLHKPTRWPSQLSNTDILRDHLPHLQVSAFFYLTSISRLTEHILCRIAPYFYLEASPLRPVLGRVK
jgi:hypothetical protein